MNTENIMKFFILICTAAFVIIVIDESLDAKRKSASPSLEQHYTQNTTNSMQASKSERMFLKMQKQIIGTRRANEIYALETKLGYEFESDEEANDMLRRDKEEKRELARINKKETDGNWVAWGKKLAYIGEGSDPDDPAYMMMCNKGKKPSFVELFNIRQPDPNKIQPDKHGKTRIGYIWDNDNSNGDWLAEKAKIIDNGKRFKATVSLEHKYLRAAAQSLLRGGVVTFTTVNAKNHRVEDLMTIKTPSKKVVNKFLSDCNQEEVPVPHRWRSAEKKADAKEKKRKEQMKVHGDFLIHHYVRTGNIREVRRYVSTANKAMLCVQNDFGQTAWRLAYILGKYEIANVIAIGGEGHLC